MSFPVTRPIGRALVIANPTARPALVESLVRTGYECGECDDPYSAALELSRRRLAYRALILSLSSLFREELSLIGTLKRRYPHIEIWLTHTDGRQAAMIEALRLGADGLLDQEGLPHRMAPPPSNEPSFSTGVAPLPPIPLPPLDAPPAEPVSSQPNEPSQMEVESESIGEPVLTADELRALLQDQTAMPPSGGESQP